MLHARSPFARIVGGAAALATLATLAAAPAQAATIPDTAPSPLTQQMSTYYVPAGEPARIDFENKGAGGSRTFPAGTYVIADMSVSGYRYPGIVGLGERFSAMATQYTVVTLDAPGPISLDIPDTREAGTRHWLSVNPAPAGIGDPAAMTPEEYSAQLQATSEAGNGAWDEASLTSAMIDAPALDTFPVPPADATNYLEGDVFGIGADVTVVQQGNRFTAVGPDGDTLTMSFGRAGDEMILGDWDGDGTDTVGVRRGNRIFLDDDWRGGTAEASFAFGRANDELLTGDWDGDGTDSVAVRRGNVFHVTNAHQSGAAAVSFSFGRVDDQAFTGDFYSTGTDRIGVIRTNPAPEVDGSDGTLFITDARNGGVTVDQFRITG